MNCMNNRLTIPKCHSWTPTLGYVVIKALHDYMYIMVSVYTHDEMAILLLPQFCPVSEGRLL